MFHLVILIFFLKFSQAQFPSYSKVSKAGSNIEGVQIPLCHYVKVEEDLEDGSELFNDPEQGCIRCKLDLQKQCTKEPRVYCRIQSVPVEVCNGCQREQQIAENTLWRAQFDPKPFPEGCQNLQETNFETVCKKYTPNRCIGSSEECPTQELCYQKPITNSEIDDQRAILCRVKRSRLRKTLRFRIPARSPQKRCIPKCERKLQSENICSTEEQESCQSVQVRVCEPMPPELCLEESKPKFRLECKGFAELKEITNQFETN